MRAGAAISLVLAAFLIVSNLPVLPNGLRQGAMLGMIISAAALAARAVQQISRDRVLAVSLPAFLIITIFGLHNLTHPALTAYAENKRILFPIVFLFCLVIFPLAIHAFDRNLKYTMLALISVSVLFALLAFVAPTGGNLRRSGIELNPLMHAKLLFFPFFLMLAGPVRSHHRILLFAALLLSIIACLKTGSRSPIAVAIVILLLDAILTSRIKGMMRLISYGGLLLASVVLLVDFLPREIAERFSPEEIWPQFEEGDRLFLFVFAIDMIQHNPTGIGMGNMSAHFWLAAPHNIVLEAIMDFGFMLAMPYVGLLAYVTMLAFRGLRSRHTPTRFVAIWYFFFLGQSLIGGEMTFPSILLYMPMGLLILTRARVTAFDKKIQSSTDAEITAGILGSRSSESETRHA